MSAARTLYARRMRAVSTLQQIIARCKSVMDAVRPLCRRCLHAVTGKYYTPVTPEWRPYSVPTAFKKMQIAKVRAERHAVVFILSMLKINAATKRLHSAF